MVGDSSSPHMRRPRGAGWPPLPHSLRTGSLARSAKGTCPVGDAARQYQRASSPLLAPAPRHDGSGLSHATPAIQRIERAVAPGNQSLLRLLKAGMIQTRLAVNEPGDRYE